MEIIEISCIKELGIKKYSLKKLEYYCDSLEGLGYQFVEISDDKKTIAFNFFEEQSVVIFKNPKKDDFDFEFLNKFHKNLPENYKIYRFIDKNLSVVVDVVSENISWEI